MLDDAIMTRDDAASWQSRRALRWSIASVGLMLLMLVGLIGRVVQLKLDPDPQLARAAGDATSSRLELASRGDIVDRCGRVLATSSVGSKLFVDPRIVADAGTIAIDLAGLLKVSPVEIDRKIAARPHSRYVVIDDLLDDWQVDAVRKAGLKGVGLEPRLVRHYLFPDIAAMLVGDVGHDQAGRGGVELTHQELLAPQHGRLTYLRDATRQPLWIQPAGYQAGDDGEPVRLTIDLVIQGFAMKRLQEAVKQCNAGGGRVVIADCVSGDILAMGDVLRSRKGWKENTSDPLRAKVPALGRNRCVTDPYEPGSTFKPFIWAVATELGKARLDELLPTPSPENAPHRTRGGRSIRDVHYYGPVTWKTVLVKSLNSGMAIIAERMNGREMREAVQRYGFGVKTGCGAAGESAGIVTDEKSWTSYSQVSVAMGQEIAVTPVQMVRAFSAFATDGLLPDLRLTLPIEEPGLANEGQAVDPALPEADGVVLRPAAATTLKTAGADSSAGGSTGRRVLSESIARTAREAMRDVITEGTGRLAQSEKYALFGKSGTAQLPRKDGKGYYEDRYVASFIAGAPLHDPRIVVLCVIDDPDRSIDHFGGKIAGPVVRDLIDQTLTYLGVPPELEPKEADTASSP
jgi:cell division protein FtsI (penicillin-binding protein 3)